MTQKQQVQVFGGLFLLSVFILVLTISRHEGVTHFWMLKF